MSSRVYVGNLPSRVTERDLEHFFRSFGRIRDIMLKNGFGFVEFEDSRDADDAVYEQNGRELMGSRVIVEMSRRKPDRYGRGYGGGGGRDYRGGGGVVDRDGRVNGRYPPPHQTRYRLIVTNLSTRFSWQDLKDMMRGAGEVTYADAHKRVRNEALVCFGSHDDLRRAMDKFQGKEINGRRIKLVDDTEGGSSSGGRRGRSRTRSPRSRSPRSRSPRGRRTRSPRSRSPRSRSPPSRSPSRSKSRTKSPAKNGDENGTSRNSKRNRSRSASSAASSGSRGGGRDSPKSDTSRGRDDDAKMDDDDEK